MNDVDWEQIRLIFYMGTIGALGAMANYLHTTMRKGHTFSFYVFVGNGCIGFVMGNIVGEFLAGYEYRDGMLWLAGFFYTYCIVYLEAKIKSAIDEKIDNG